MEKHEGKIFLKNRLNSLRRIGIFDVFSPERQGAQGRWKELKTNALPHRFSLMFARLLLAPLLLAASVLLYLAWKYETASFAYGLAPLLVGAAVVFVLSPQINWWWYSRHPRDLSPRLTAMLEQHQGFYRGLPKAQQLLFRQRVELFRMGTDWTPVGGWPEDMGVPPDVQLAIAAQAVMLTFGRPVFLFEKFEKVIVYPQAFASPDYPFFHASELYEPDGCALFSAEHVLQGFLQPGKMYNVALHEYARAFVRAYPNEPWPAVETPEHWEAFEKISAMSRQYVDTFVGLAGVEALPVAIHHFFTFPEKFAEILPDEAAVLQGIFDAIRL